MLWRSWKSQLTEHGVVPSTCLCPDQFLPALTVNRRRQADPRTFESEAVAVAFWRAACHLGALQSIAPTAATARGRIRLWSLAPIASIEAQLGV